MLGESVQRCFASFPYGKHVNCRAGKTFYEPSMQIWFSFDGGLDDTRCNIKICETKRLQNNKLQVELYNYINETCSWS